MIATADPIGAKRQAPAGITIVSNRLRSTNLERDVRDEHLGPVHVGVRAQDVLERVAAALEDPARTRAWSLTGPYGAGKSTLALVTASLLSRDITRRAEADKVLGEASPVLARRFTEARDHRAPEGFITCVSTARREPLLASVGRALRIGVGQAWRPRQTPKHIRDALGRLDEPDFGNQDIVAAVRAICHHSPVLLVIDEFGKTLEHLASRGEFADAGSDVFLLQELAELGAGARGMPLYLLTLQHLSFADYASRTTALQTREWAKIQGRFEDTLMTSHLGDAVELIRQTLDHTNVAVEGRELIAAHAVASTRAWTSRGLDGILPADRDLFADIYPLHPLAAVVAPLLAAQIGQHDRSVTGFIANDEPSTVRRFLANFETSTASTAATVQLADVYDYFFTSGRTTILASANASRWMEIDNRLAEANGLPDEDQAILKTVGTLNLVDSSGALRASLDTILFALCDPLEDNKEDTRQTLADRVHDLCTRGFLVYREFSDEYRVWRGSDVDLTTHIELLINSCDDHAAVSVVSSYLPTAVVAGKHSQRTGMLRHFSTKATDAASPEMAWPPAADPADGLLVFHFGDADSLPPIRTQSPVVVGVTADARSVLSAARYLHALQELPDNVDLDAVASHEISERTAQAGAELATRVAEAFSPNQPAASWFLLLSEEGVARWTPTSPTIRGRSLAALVSSACETVFPKAPHIRNEMLGRHTLTSQGAKARRELMLAMIDAPTRQYLGIEGYGPERAMYSGVLEYLKLHGLADDREDKDTALLPFGFREPDTDNSLYPAWAAMREQIQKASVRPLGLDAVYALLEGPPFGVRPGVIPIIVLAVLIIGNQEIAIFEEGTYQVRLTAPLAERILKNPERFAVKTMGVQAGPRKAAIREIAQELGVHVPPTPPVASRNVAPLAVTRDLLDRTRALSAFAERTQQLSDAARAVRTTLRTAREPDALLFNDLPKALGLEPIDAQGTTDTDASRVYAQSLNSALAEISQADRRLQAEVIQAIANAFHLPSDLPKLRRQLAALTRHLADVSLVEPRLRGVIALTQSDALSDEDWIDPFVVRIVGRGLADWRDGDITTFANEVRAVARAIERLAHLHQPATTQTDEAFDTRVVTVTRADGQESQAVIRIPEARRAAASQLVADVIEQARRNIGEHGERVLLALLAETVVGEQDTGNDTTPRPRRKSSR